MHVCEVALQTKVLFANTIFSTLCFKSVITHFLARWEQQKQVVNTILCDMIRVISLHGLLLHIQLLWSNIIIYFKSCLPVE